MANPWSELKSYAENDELLSSVRLSSPEHFMLMHNMTIAICDLYRRINELEREKGKQIP